MPYRNQRGSWRTRKRFGLVGGVHVGPINVSLNTNDENQATLIEQAVFDLALPDKPRPDLLLEIRDGKRSPFEIWQMSRRQNLGTLVNVHNGGEGLQKAFDKWLTDARSKAGMKLAARTINSYRGVSGLLLKSQFAGKDPSVAQLPDIYRKFRDYYHGNEQYRTVVKGKALCLSFARSHQKAGIQSDLYKAIQALPGAPTKVKKPSTGLTVWQVRKILKNMQNPTYRNIAHLMAFTGALASEYISGIEILPDRVLIHGEKRDTRDRYVPRITDFTLETMSYDYRLLNADIKQAAGIDVTHKDLRATYKQWLTDAGIPHERVKFYMGWKRNSVVDAYSNAGTMKGRKDFEHDSRLLAAYIEANKEEPEQSDVDQTPIRIQSFL